MIRIFLIATALTLSGSLRASPVDASLYSRILDKSLSSECADGHDKIRESLIGAAVVGTLAPIAAKAITSGMAAAFRRASGANDSDESFETIAPAYSFSYDINSKQVAWSLGRHCLEVGSYAESKNGNPILRAILPIIVSPDQLSARFSLTSLVYAEKLGDNRKLKEMAMSISILSSTGEEVDSVLIPGPFRPHKSPFQATSERQISSDWISISSLRGNASAVVSGYEKLCSQRTNAVALIRSELNAKVVQLTTQQSDLKDELATIPGTDESKRDEIETELSALDDEIDTNRDTLGRMIPRDDPGAPCGIGIPLEARSVEGVRYGWSMSAEENLRGFAASLQKLSPMTFKVTVTETPKVSKLLLGIAELIEANDEDLNEMLTTILDPQKQQALAATEQKSKLEANSAFEISVATFKEKARLYHKAAEDATAAEENAAISPTPEALEQVETARAARAVAFVEALTARSVALSAAIDAGIHLPAEHPVLSFP